MVTAGTTHCVTCDVGRFTNSAGATICDIHDDSNNSNGMGSGVLAVAVVVPVVGAAVIILFTINYIKKRRLASTMASLAANGEGLDIAMTSSDARHFRVNDESI
jgi:hypothetical protein